MTGFADLMVARLGEFRYDSPLADFVADRRTNEHYVDQDDRVIFPDTMWQPGALAADPRSLPSFEPGGPRRRLFFPPGSTRVGLANHEADFVLIPGVPFTREGPGGFLASLHQRLKERPATPGRATPGRT